MIIVVLGMAIFLFGPEEEEKTTSPQDPDIKDRKGTQPKAYHGKDAKGREMSKSTKAARDRHFKKGIITLLELYVIVIIATVITIGNCYFLYIQNLF